MIIRQVAYLLGVLLLLGGHPEEAVDGRQYRDEQGPMPVDLPTPEAPLQNNVIVIIIIIIIIIIITIIKMVVMANARRITPMPVDLPTPEAHFRTRTRSHLEP
jgi:hypothetical protein